MVSYKYEARLERIGDLMRILCGVTVMYADPLNYLVFHQMENAEGEPTLVAVDHYPASEEIKVDNERVEASEGNFLDDALMQSKTHRFPVEVVRNRTAMGVSILNGTSAFINVSDVVGEQIKEEEWFLPDMKVITTTIRDLAWAVQRKELKPKNIEFEYKVAKQRQELKKEEQRLKREMMMEA